MKSKIKTNIMPLIILIIAAASIYGLPYFRYAYWNTFMETFKVNNSEMANLQTIYGVFALISYFPGGWLADKISIKKLLMFSFLGTGLSGLWLMTIPSYTVIFIIHGFWGITTILTFWPAFIKAIRSLANNNEQGKVFGFMESGRGIANIFIGSSALLIFSTFEHISRENAMMKVILFYSLILLITGGLTFVFLKEIKEEENKIVKTTFSDTFSIFKTVLVKPSVWLISGIVFCSYFMNIAFYSFTPYAEDILKVSPVIAGLMVVLAQWARPISALLAGFFADILTVYKTVFIGFILMIIGILGIVLLPTAQSPLFIFILLIILIYLGMYGLQANHFALLEEGQISKKETGTAVGIISTLGYLPEVIASQVGLFFLVRFQDSSGNNTILSYKSYFLFLGLIFVIGLICIFLFKKYYSKKNVLITAQSKTI